MTSAAVNAAAIGASVRTYYGDAGRMARMRALLAGFVRPGDLAFDVGAHVGDRTACLRALGARVVAVEPQPACLRALRLIHGRDAGVTLVAAAAGAAEGRLTLRLNSANPTVATGSAAFVQAAADAPGWQGQVWDGAVEVAQTTLDALIAAHGAPAFVKIDVEGLEDRVLAGLSHPVRALSFEFTTLQRDVAARALGRLSALGAYRFNASLGESHALAHADWMAAADIGAWLAALPDTANSGDIYARL